MNRSLIKWLAILTLSTAVGNAQASATATAELDWDDFTVTFYSLSGGPAPSITWSSQTSSVWADTDSATNSDYVNDWTTHIMANAGASTDPTYSSAHADGNELMADAVDNDTSSNSSSSAYSYRSGTFTVSGNGLLVFSVPYELSAALTSAGNEASAYAYLQANQIGSSLYTQAGDSIYYYAPGSSSISDMLNLALLVSDGQQYNFYASAFSSANAAVVPVPAAVWLFTSGLVSFLAIRRRPTHA